MTKELCPIFLMKEMINAILAKPDAPLFLIPGRVAGQWVPLTYRKLSMQLKEWTLKAIGQQDGWTLHFLRRRGAVWSFNVDISTEAIRLMGDWASDVYKQYLDMDVYKRAESMEKFTSNIDKMFVRS